MLLAGKSSIIKVAVVLLLFFAACKESAPAKSASNNQPATKESAEPSPPYVPSKTSPAATDTDPCARTDTSTDSDSDSDSDSDEEDPFALTGSFGGSRPTLTRDSALVPKKVKRNRKRRLKSTESKPRFGLTDTVSYDSTIKSILASNCTSCHKAGGNDPDLSSYSLAKAGLAKSIEQIDGDKMPSSTPLSSSDKAKFHAWLDAGTPETSSDSTDDSDSDSSNDSSSDCDRPSSDSDDELSDSDDDLENPPELQECKDKGKVFDRKAGECHKADLAEYSCDDAGIVEAFKKVGINASTKLKSIEGEGYKIDQCGVFDKEPIVYFIKKGDVEADSVSLKIKKLCKPTAAVCK